MKKIRLFSLLLGGILAVSDLMAAEAAAPPKAAAKLTKLEKHLAIVTTPTQAPRHIKRHQAKKAWAAANKDKVKIVMIGDSITHQWEYKPAAAARKKYLDPYGVLNLGCGADRTHHTLWIVEKSGILELVKPNLVVIMIGTNNRNHHYKATAAAIKRIVGSTRKVYPEAKILLYAIFPRGKDSNDKFRKVNDKVNDEIVKLCNGKDIIWVDIRKDFLTPDGRLEKSVMPDYLHPKNSSSYEIWGRSLLPYFEKYGK